MLLATFLFTLFAPVEASEHRVALPGRAARNVSYTLENATTSALPFTSATTSITHPIVTFSPTGIITNHTTLTAPVSTSNGSCAGTFVNVPSASLDWWAQGVYEYAVSTFYLEFNANDTSTSWTLIPATTTFNVTDAIASPLSVQTLTWDPDHNTSDFDWQYYTTPAPIFAATTVVTQTAFKPVNSTAGPVPVPSPVITPAPASIVLPGPADAQPTAYTGTPIVYFSAYQVDKLVPVDYHSGNTTCSTSREAYNLSTPFAFAYDGLNPDGTATVTGRLPSDFLDKVDLPSLTAGTWEASPTLIVVEELIYVVVGVLAAVTGITESIFLTPTLSHAPTVSNPSTTEPGKSVLRSHYIDVSIDVSVVTLVGHFGHSETSFMVPKSTDGSDTLTTTIDGTVVVATEITPAPTVAPQSTGTSLSQAADNDGEISFASIGKPFFAHIGSSEISFDAPAPTDGGDTITTVIGGITVVATAGTVTATPTALADNLPNTQEGSGIASAILSAIAGGADSKATVATVHGTSSGDLQAQATAKRLEDTSSSSEGSGGAGVGNIISAINVVGNDAGPSVLATPHGQGASTSSSLTGGLQSSAPGPTQSSSQSDGSGLGLAASAIIIGGITAKPIGHESTILSNQAYAIGGQTLQAGGDVITVDGTRLSLAPSASRVVVNGVTEDTSPRVTPPPMITFGGTLYKANSGSTFEIDDQALTPGGIITIGATTLSLGDEMSILVVNDMTESLLPSAAVSDLQGVPTLTINGQTYVANAQSRYIIDGQTLTAGSMVTLAGGATLSLEPLYSGLVINGVTSTIAAQPIITAPPSLTINGQLFMAASGGSYIISGETLTPGGAITFEGPNGLETVSLDKAGTAIVDEVHGAKTTSTIPTSLPPAATAAPLLTFAGQTFTALPGPGPSYLIKGKTLSPGGVLTETISGQTYVMSLSLSPSAPVLEIEEEGPGGTVTATTFETLLPATASRATETAKPKANHIDASSSVILSPSLSTSSSASPKSTFGTAQSSATILQLGLGMTIAALSVLGLVIWL